MNQAANRSAIHVVNGWAVEERLVLALKGNQPDLHAEVKLFFETARSENFARIPHGYEETTDKEHSRIEIRKYWQVSNIGWLGERHLWTGLESIGRWNPFGLSNENLQLRLAILSIASPLT